MDINQLTDLYGLEWVDYLEYLTESVGNNPGCQENFNNEEKYR